VTTPNIPLPLDQRLLAVGRQLLDTVSAGLVNPPDAQFLSGPFPAVDWLEDCGDNCPGQLTVSLIRISRGIYGRPESGNTDYRPGVTALTAEWHIELWRYWPVAAEGIEPQIQDSAGAEWIRDYAAVHTAIRGLLNPSPQSTPARIPGASAGALVDLAALEPQGGTRGLRAIVQITVG
jgi:hypothetical protein